MLRPFADRWFSLTLLVSLGLLNSVAAAEEPVFLSLSSRAVLSEPATLVDQVNAQRAALLKSLQQLQDAYCRTAQLDEALAVREQIRRLQQDGSISLQPVVTTDPRRPAVPAPGSVFKSPNEVSGQVGQVFYALVTGESTGSVWGSDWYTSDSDLNAAALHAGLVKRGETRVVRYVIRPGRESYAGSDRNGVTTRAWQSYPSSFQILDAAIVAEGENLSKYRDSETERLTLFIVGASTDAVHPESAYTKRAERMLLDSSSSGTISFAVMERVPSVVIPEADGVAPPLRTIWGGEDRIYTDDSAVATAAVHAGLVKPGEPAFVTVEFLAGRPEYKGSTQHGMTSQSYGNWSGSYRIHPALADLK